MITVFTLINQFICLFLKKLNNFVGFLTPVLKKKAHSHKKPHGCSPSSLPSRVS